MNKVLILTISVLVGLPAFCREFILYKTPNLEARFLFLETDGSTDGKFSASNLIACNTVTVLSVSNGVALKLGDVTFYQTQKTMGNNSDIVRQFMTKFTVMEIKLNEHDRIIFQDKILEPTVFLRNANELLKNTPITTNGAVLVPIPQLNSTHKP